MPNIDIFDRNIFVKPKVDVLYKTNVTALHNGVLGYNADTHALNVDNYNLEERTQLVEKSPDAADVLSAPGINNCSLLIIKSRSNPNSYAMAHIAPMDDHPKVWNELLTKFAPGEPLDIISFQSGDLEFLTYARNKGYQVASFRDIPSTVFNIDTDGIDRTVVHIGGGSSWNKASEQLARYVHFYFIPETDQLVIYSDSYRQSKKHGLHIGYQVFDNPNEPISFHQVMQLCDLVPGSSNKEKLESYLPFLTKKFKKDYSQSIAHDYETCPDHVAQGVAAKKAAAIKVGCDFLSSAHITPEQLVEHEQRVEFNEKEEVASPVSELNPVPKNDFLNDREQLVEFDDDYDYGYCGYEGEEVASPVNETRPILTYKSPLYSLTYKSPDGIERMTMMGMLQQIEEAQGLPPQNQMQPFQRLEAIEKRLNIEPGENAGGLSGRTVHCYKIVCNRDEVVEQQAPPVIESDVQQNAAGSPLSAARNNQSFFDNEANLPKNEPKNHSSNVRPFFLW